MLVLSRKLGEQIVIGKGGEIVLKVKAIERRRIKIGITAPKSMRILRGEIVEDVLAREAQEGEDNAADQQTESCS